MNEQKKSSRSRRRQTARARPALALMLAALLVASGSVGPGGTCRAMAPDLCDPGGGPPPLEHLFEQGIRQFVRGSFDYADGCLSIVESDGRRWHMAGERHAAIEREMRAVIEAYWEYASLHGGVIAVSGAEGLAFRTICIALRDKDGPAAPTLGSVIFNEYYDAPAGGTAGGIDEPGRADVVFEMGMNYRVDQLKDLVQLGGWADRFLDAGRMLDPALRDTHRKALEGAFGKESGAGLFAFASDKYAQLYSKEAGKPFLILKDLPADTWTDGCYNAVFSDDLTARTTLYIHGR